MANYVYFQRGSKAAYDALKSANRIDNNALYFIYDSEDSSTGSLYLGTKLISGGQSTVVSSSLGDLTDVIITGAQTNSFLVKDDNDTWVAKTAEQVAELIQSYIKVDNFSIELNQDTNTLSLKNFNKGYYKYIAASLDSGTQKIIPSHYEYINGSFIEGLIPKVIRNGSNLELSWYEPSPELENNLNELKQNIYTKEETNTAISNAIANADHLRRTIVNSIDDININANDALQYIYMVPIENNATENNKYNEFIVIEYLVDNTPTRILEKVGSWEVNLDNYYTKDEINNLLFIKSVDSNFIVNETGQLSLNPVAGRLITQDEVSALQKVIDGEFNNFIKSVNTNIFSVNVDGKLDLTSIPTSLLTPVIGDITKLPNYAEGTTIVNEINNIYDRLTWQEIPQII